MEASDPKGCSINKKPLLLVGWLLLFGWIVIALLLDLFWVELWDKFSILVGYLRFLLWLGFAILVVYSIVSCVIKRAKLAVIGLLITVILVGFCYGSFGGKLRFQLRFQIMKRQYESAIILIANLSGKSPDIHYELDQGCVAFPWYDGPLDHWAGIVYDPDEILIMKRDLGEKWRLFDGYVRGCKPLGGPWYFCWFS